MIEKRAFGRTGHMSSATLFGAAALGSVSQSEAERTLAELERLRATEYVEPLLVAELCVALGDHKQLRLWFNRGYEERSSLFVYGPIMKDYYGNDPEVEALIAKVR